MTKKKLYQIAKNQGFTFHQMVLKRIYEITTTAPESTLEQSHGKIEDLTKLFKLCVNAKITHAVVQTHITRLKSVMDNKLYNTPIVVYESSSNLGKATRSEKTIKIEKPDGIYFKNGSDHMIKEEEVKLIE